MRTRELTAELSKLNGKFFVFLERRGIKLLDDNLMQPASLELEKALETLSDEDYAFVQELREEMVSVKKAILTKNSLEYQITMFLRAAVREELRAMMGTRGDQDKHYSTQFPSDYS